MIFYVNELGEIKDINTNKNNNPLLIEIEIANEDNPFQGWPESKICCFKITAANGKITSFAPYVDITAIELAQAEKLKEIAKECEKTIHAGIDVALSTGIEHFSLTTNDQINLFGKQSQLAAGLQQFEYHQDGDLCRYYSAADMSLIIQAAMTHVSYHTTYCNSLNVWIRNTIDKEVLSSIHYGSEVPEEYISEVLRDYVTITEGEKLNEESI